MMDVKLVVVGGKHAGTEINVPGPKFFIGRAEDCHLRPQSEQISRHHAAILLESGFVVVRDLGSRNGTHVNGNLISGDQELKNGDRVKLGPLEFKVELAVSLSGRKRPKVRSVGEAVARTAESNRPDLDIFNLLGEDEKPPSKTVADHPTVHSAPTTAINHQEMDTVAGEQAKDKPKEKDDTEEKKKAENKQDALGQKQGKETFGDTRSAAADALREFMKRKQ